MLMSQMLTLIKEQTASLCWSTAGLIIYCVNRRLLIVWGFYDDTEVFIFHLPLMEH